MHVQLVTNPDAGSYKPRVIESLRKALSEAGATTSLTYVGPGKQLLIEQDSDIVCVAGGDGTFRHAAKSLVDTQHRARLAPYPMGTINLYHRDTALPGSLEAFAASLTKQVHTAQHYPVCLNDTLFLGCASIGPDSVAVATVSTRLKKIIGRAAYGVALLGLLIRWPRPQLTLVADGKSYTTEAIYIAKGAHFAGPWSFAPNAQRTNPKLHVIALKKASRRHYLRFIRNVAKGRPLEDRDNLIVLTCVALTIESVTPCPVQADGDDVGTTPAHIATLVQPINVV